MSRQALACVGWKLLQTFVIEYDEERDVLIIDGVECSPLVLQSMICHPDPKQLLRCKREGNVTHVEVVKKDAQS